MIAEEDNTQVEDDMTEAEAERLEALVGRVLDEIGDLPLEPATGAAVDIEATVAQVLADERIVCMRAGDDDGRE